MSNATTEFVRLRWVTPLEEATDLRVQRRKARIMVRKGRVRSMKVRPGLITAMVNDEAGNIISVKVRMDAVDSDVWEDVIERLSADASLSADLLQGRLTEEMCEVFEECGQDLFPFDVRDISNFCACRERNAICSHALATQLRFGDIISQDPMQLLHFRGRDAEELVKEVRSRRRAQVGDAVSETEEVDANHHLEDVSTLDESNTFWQRGVMPHLAFQVVRAELNDDESLPVLRALGSGPGGVDPDAVAVTLAPLMRSSRLKLATISDNITSEEAEDMTPDSTDAQSLDDVLVAAAHQHGSLTSGFVAEALGITPREARQYLKWLVEEGRLAVVGRARATRYIPPNSPEALEAAAALEGATAH